MCFCVGEPGWPWTPASAAGLERSALTRWGPGPGAGWDRSSLRSRTMTPVKSRLSAYGHGDQGQAWPSARSPRTGFLRDWFKPAPQGLGPEPQRLPCGAPGGRSSPTSPEQMLCRHLRANRSQKQAGNASSPSQIKVASLLDEVPVDLWRGHVGVRGVNRLINRQQVLLGHPHLLRLGF